MKKVIAAAFAFGVVAAYIFTSGVASAGGGVDQSGRVEVSVFAGGRGLTTTDGGNLSQVHAPMCFSSSSCVEIAVPATGGDGGDVNALVSAGQWYEVTVIADGSGSLAGCWAAGAKIGTSDAGASSSCFGLPKFKDGQVKPMAWAPIAADGGLSTSTATVWFYATITGGYAVTMCPEVACQ